jgi:RNA polymerase sigma-70 factor (ECF subfamily)
LQTEEKVRNDDIVRLFKLYANDLYRFALSYLGSKQDAEDVVQEVYLKLLNRSLLLIKGQEKAYLMKMTANRCKDLLDSPARKTGVELESAVNEVACFHGFSEDDKELFNELMDLDETLRIPLYLYYYGGYSQKEIAKIINTSEAAVTMRIKRAKERLRKKWSDKNE